jgi:pyruvate,water dikinase
MLDTSLVVPLLQVSAGELAVAGGKASNLGELIRAGFKVPEGFVVSTRGFREALDGAGLRSEGLMRAVVDPQGLRAKMESLEIPPPLAGAIPSGLPGTR